MRSLLLIADSQKNTPIDTFLVIDARVPLSDNAVWTAEKTIPLDRELGIEDATMSLFARKKYGEVSVLAYSKTEIGLGILNILPEREVIYRTARHPGGLSRWLSLDRF